MDSADKQKAFDLISRINWDYNYTNEELLALIKKAGDTSNMRLCFFIKSLETFTWQELVFLWGMEECDRLYTDKVRRGIFQKSIREAYDGLFWLLRNKTILPSKRSPEELEKFKEALLLKRRNRSKRGALMSL